MACAGGWLKVCRIVAGQPFLRPLGFSLTTPPGLLFVNNDWSGFVPAFAQSCGISLDVATGFGDLYHRMQAHRPGLERVVARAGVGTFIGCMSGCVGNPARDVAVDFYAHMLAGVEIAWALCLARTAHYANDDGETAMMFAMAGYPDVQITTAAPTSPTSSGRAARRRRS